MMSELAKQARADMKDKARRMGGGEDARNVDASSWTPCEPENADIQTGPRPVSRRQFACGGTAMAPRADRMARKSGGVVNEYVNRDVKAANEDRAGTKHVGGMKRGGGIRTGNKSVSNGTLEGTRPVGGRLARAAGGSAGKGKMNVNIIIGQPGGGAPPPAQMAPPMPPPHPPVMPPPMPPPGTPPMGGMPPSGPPGMMPPMGRATGGRTYRSYKDMDAGALGGKGRLEKIEIQRNK